MIIQYGGECKIALKGGGGVHWHYLFSPPSTPSPSSHFLLCFAFFLFCFFDPFQFSVDEDLGIIVVNKPSGIPSWLLGWCYDKGEWFCFIHDIGGGGIGLQFVSKKD